MLNFRIVLTRTQLKTLDKRYRLAQNQAELYLLPRIIAIKSAASGMSVEKISQLLNISDVTVRSFIKKYLLSGLRGLYRKRPSGRPPKLTKSQKKQLMRTIDKGPSQAGFPGNCWRSPMIQHWLYTNFKVVYSVKYISQLLKNMGYSFQKARFVSDHLDQEKRKEWIEEKFPEILVKAKKKNAYILFGDEASFPQWGSLSYTWAKRGQQPTVQTSGKRKGYKVFGLIDYFTGEFFFKCQEERLNSETYEAFLIDVISNSTRHIILIQDGARYHTSKHMIAFFKLHKDRITCYSLPSYSPDYNPIEKLWKKIKEKGTHRPYFPTFDALKNKVHQTLDWFKDTKNEVLSLFDMYKEIDNKD